MQILPNPIFFNKAGRSFLLSQSKNKSTFTYGVVGRKYKVLFILFQLNFCLEITSFYILKFFHLNFHF